MGTKMTANIKPELQEKIARYESFLKVDPSNALLWTSMGDLYHQAGHFDQAIACFEKSLANNSDQAVPKGRIASVLISQHRFEEAERLLSELTQNGETHPAIMHNLGLTLYHQRRWSDALEAFSKSHQADPNQVSNLTYLAYTLHHLGDTENALKYAELWHSQASDIHSESYLALLEMDHGDMENAHQRAEKVLAEDPENTDAAAVMGTYMVEQQDIEHAAKHFNRIIHNDPDNPRGWLGLGLIQLYQQKHTDAVRSLEKALTYMPDNTGTIATLGWAKLTNKDANGAEAEFRRAINTDNTFGEAHGGLAVSLIFLGRFDEAKHEIEVGKRLDPHGFGAVFAQSILLQLQGRKNLAQKLLARLLEQAPKPGGTPLIAHIQSFVQQTVKGPAREPQNKDTIH
jgi:tetratricopeptide (TPR) repeat protein